MESDLLTPHLLCSKEDLKGQLPDFIIQSFYCLEMLPLIKFVLETQYKKHKLKHMSIPKKKKSCQSGRDQWLLRFSVHTGFSLITGRHVAAGAKRRGKIYGGATLNMEHSIH